MNQNAFKHTVLITIKASCILLSISSNRPCQGLCWINLIDYIKTASSFKLFRAEILLQIIFVNIPKYLNLNSSHNRHLLVKTVLERNY